MSAEFEMIAELTDGLAFGPDVRLGPGDDAAVLVPGWRSTSRTSRPWGPNPARW